MWNAFTLLFIKKTSTHTHTHTHTHPVTELFTILTTSVSIPKKVGHLPPHSSLTHSLPHLLTLLTLDTPSIIFFNCCCIVIIPILLICCRYNLRSSQVSSSRWTPTPSATTCVYVSAVVGHSSHAYVSFSVFVLDAYLLCVFSFSLCIPLCLSSLTELASHQKDTRYTASILITVFRHYQTLFICMYSLHVSSSPTQYSTSPHSSLCKQFVLHQYCLHVECYLISNWMPPCPGIDSRVPITFSRNSSYS
jgi:hypothetical protein